MATVIYILLQRRGFINEPNDLVNLCFLIALDQLFWVMFAVVLVLLVRMRRGRSAGL